MSTKKRFSYLKMQMQRPRRLHSNTVFVKNFYARVMASRAVPPTAEQIRQQGIALAFKLFP